MSVVLQVLGALCAMGLLVGIHEFGHFLAAKVFGIAAPVFSIGFGPRVGGFRIGETDVRISVLPFGGYVRMAGADPFATADDPAAEAAAYGPDRLFQNKPVWQRLIVMAAGPLANLLLPVALFTVLNMTGRPELRAQVMDLREGSAAVRAGFKAGDVIQSVNGQPTGSWGELVDRLQQATPPVSSTTFTVERASADGQSSETLTLTMPGTWSEDDKRVDGPVPFGLLPYRVLARVGIQDPSSLAGRAGLETGDLIEAIDGQPVEAWHDLPGLLGVGIHTLRVTRDRDEPGDDPTNLEVTLDVPEGASVEEGLGLLPISRFVRTVQPSSPAMRAGIQPGDMLISLEGEPVVDFTQFSGIVQRLQQGQSGSVPLHLVIGHQGQTRELTIVPDMVVVNGEAFARPVIGIGNFGPYGAYPDRFTRRYPLFPALKLATLETGGLLWATTSLLGNMVIGRADVRDNLGGPVAIVQVTSKATRDLFTYGSAIAMLSIGLGLMNLLPVPALDGGHIVFLAFEAIRGRPLSVEVRERMLLAGVMLLVALMLFATANDITRWVRGG